MTPVKQRAPGRWQVGTVTGVKQETPRVKSFRISLPMWMPHLPGQHYDVRLTAPDGYSAQRSYSIASSPLDEGEIELTIDRLDDGEVSPYFHDVVVVGDQVEVRGPFASYFVWRGEQPVLLVGGGSGVVPLMAMLRHRRRTMPEPADAARVLRPVRRGGDLRRRARRRRAAHLHAAAAVRLDGPHGAHRRRADRCGRHLVRTAFVCGSNGFVESAATCCSMQASRPSSIRTERFGPTG